MAAHTRLLIEQRRASVLVVAGEHADSEYSRPRVTLDCAVRIADDVEAGAIWTALDSRHGAIVQTLQALPDFRALALEPSGGRLVLGFGAARDLSAAGIAENLEAAQA